MYHGAGGQLSEVSASGSYFNASGHFWQPGGQPRLPARLAVAPAGGGGVAITGGDVLGRIYTIQCVDDLSLTNWQTLGVATNSPAGFQFIDALPPPRRFYRSVCQ